MKPLPLLAGLVLFSIAMGGCALFAKKPLGESALQGRIEDNTYTSPGETFRFRLPWLSDGATFRDQTFGPDTVLVTIADNLCRQFIVSQRPGYLGAQPLDSWVNEHIVNDLKGMGFEVRRQPLLTVNGPAIALRYHAPAAAPCGHVVNVDGKEISRKRDADVGWYVYHRDGKFFRLIYLIGTGPGVPEVWYVKREPVDEVLAQFASGFSILSAKDAANHE